MSKRKIIVMLVLAGGYMMVLGMNCLPNIGGTAFMDLFSPG